MAGAASHLLAAGASGFGGDVVGALLGVDLPAEVDGKPDEHHHHEAGGHHPDRDGAAFVASTAHHPRSLQVSIGLVMVALMRRLPGTPGTDRSDRSRRHWTVTETVAASPTARLKSLASTATSTSRQWMSWLDRLVVAAEIALRPSPSCCALDRGGAGGVGGGGLDRLVGRGGAAAEDDQPDEQHERGHADGGLDGSRAAFVARPRASHGAVSLSTGTEAT